MCDSNATAQHSFMDASSDTDYYIFKTMTVIRYDINIFVRGTRSGRLSQKCWADSFFIRVNDVDYELAIKVGKF